jgi:hypothetical protein
MLKYKNHIKTSKSATVVLTGDDGDDVVKTIRHTDDRYAELCRYLDEGDTDSIVELLDLATRIGNAASGRLNVERGTGGKRPRITDQEGNEMPEVLVDKVAQLAASGSDSTGLEAFWQGGKGRGAARGLMNNPSSNSRDQLYEFIRQNDCNITETGHFILYKGVNHDRMSGHSSTHRVRVGGESVDGKTTWKAGQKIPMLHTVGKFLEIPRGDCTDNPNASCASGLHAAPWNGSYLNSGLRVELLIDPADVVSVPLNCRGGKLRCCRYKVIREMRDGDKPHEAAVVIKTKRAASSAVSRRVRDAAGTDKIVVDLSTDRLTIPIEFCARIGVEPSSTVQVFATDARSRFVVVAAKNAKAVQRATVKKVMPFNQEVKTTTRGAVSIRDRLLRLAKISGVDRYEIKVVKVGRTNVLEIRKA